MAFSPYFFIEVLVSFSGIYIHNRIFIFSYSDVGFF